MSDTLAKILEGLVKALIYVLPAVGSLIGGPLGWIIGKVLASALSILERAARFARIDAVIIEQIKQVRSTLEKLKEAEKKGEGEDEALQNFRVAVAKLSRVQL